MPICCICKHDLSRGRSQPDLSAFSFPKDKTELQQWLGACGPSRPNKPNSLQNLICEDHFMQEAFEFDNEGHKRLKPGACPMEYVGEVAPKSQKRSRPEESPIVYIKEEPVAPKPTMSRAAKTSKLSTEDSYPLLIKTVLVQEVTSKIKASKFPLLVKTAAAPKLIPKVKAQTISTQTDFDTDPLRDRQCKCQTRKEKMPKMFTKGIQHTPKGNPEISVLKRQISRLKQEVIRAKESRNKNKVISAHMKKKIVWEVLSEKYTEAQIGGMHMDSMRAKKWCEDDVKQAYGMYAISPKAYEYMRALNLIMLPSKTILCRYAASGFVWKESQPQDKRCAKKDASAEMEIDQDQSNDEELSHYEEEKTAFDEAAEPPSDPRLDPSDPRLDPSDPRLDPSDPRSRLNPSDPRLKLPADPRTSVFQPDPGPSRMQREPIPFIEFETEEPKFDISMGQSSSQYDHNPPYH